MSVATVVRGLAAEVLQKEHEAREIASRRYPKLIELKTADAKSIAELQDVMRVLGKSPSDISADLETLRRAREMLEVIRRGVRSGGAA